MDVVVVGSGAMGSLFGGFLSDAGHQVTLVNRPGPHLESVRENGLTVVTTDGTEHVIDIATATDTATLEPPDLILLFVKSIQTEAAIQDTQPIVGSDTDVLTLQNGLGNAETIGRYVSRENVIAGITSQGSILVEPGRIIHSGTGPTRLGRFYRPNDSAVEQVAGQLTAAGIDTSVTSAVKDTIWEKVLVNIGINAPTALAGVRNGMMATTAVGPKIVEAAVTEGVAVAEAEGRTIRNDILEYVTEIAHATEPNKSSMLQDVEHGRKTEIETMNGEIVKRGCRHDLDVTANRLLTHLIKLTEAGFDD